MFDNFFFDIFIKRFVNIWFAMRAVEYKVIKFTIASFSKLVQPKNIQPAEVTIAHYTITIIIIAFVNWKRWPTTYWKSDKLTSNWMDDSSEYIVSSVNQHTRFNHRFYIFHC